jgi:hypothetical protein
LLRSYARIHPASKKFKKIAKHGSTGELASTVKDLDPKDTMEVERSRLHGGEAEKHRHPPVRNVGGEPG